ncbi:MAG: DUF4271 domain-containing protein [Bacteroidales bacterium]
MTPSSLLAIATPPAGQNLPEESDNPTAGTLTEAQIKEEAFIRRVETDGATLLPYKRLFDGTPRENRYSEGIVLILFMLLALFAQNSYFYRRSFGELLLAPFSKVAIRRIHAERNLIFSRVSLNLLLVFLVTAPLALFASVTWFRGGAGMQYPDIWPTLLLYFGAIGLWLATKAAFHKFLGFVFLQPAIADHYNFVFFLGIKGIGAALFPLVAAVPLLPTHAMIWIIAAMILVVLIYTFALIFQWIQLIEGEGEQHYYLIAYICTFEILPLLVVTKLLLSS